MVRLIRVVAESVGKPVSCVSNCYNTGLDSISKHSWITKEEAYNIFYVLVLKIKICNFCGQILQLYLLGLKTREHGLEILNVGGIKCKNVYEMEDNVDTDLWKAISILSFLKPTPWDVQPN